jgi:phage terminase large subunit
MIIETPYYERLPRPFRPASVAQKAALDCPVEFLKMGGAAGSLKSSTLLTRALKYYQRPTYKAMVVRKTYPEIRFLIDRTRELYSNTGGRFYEAEKTWKWPWGASIDFKYIERDADVHKHQGWEYQFIGFDESTHQTEFQIRYLLNSRMRSTEGIPMQMMLATNPGNISHKMHKAIFQGNKCSHCILKEAKLAKRDPIWPEGTREPFHIFHDAVWPSDKISINHSTCFIPGNVADHSLFGAGGGLYAKKLRGLPKALQEALLEGCWEAFEGQFFDCFDVNTHVIPRDAVGDKEWWPHWVGIDYGFGHATAAYLFTISPERIVYTLAEYIIHGRKAVDVAQDLKKIWGHHNIKVWYMSPDVFRHDGTEDLSRAEQMSQATGIYYDQAYNERISGAMLMYTMLAEKRWLICDTCEVLPVALQSRVHEQKNPEDVHKDETEDDDAYDGARYGIASYINPTAPPLEEQLRELQENAWSKDPTCAMLQYQQYISKLNQQTGSLDYGASRGRRR